MECQCECATICFPFFCASLLTFAMDHTGRMPKVEKRVKMHVERVAPYREMFAPLDHPNAAPSSSASTAMAEQFGVDTSAAASVVASADEKMGEAFDPSVDPRPRHFKEAEELNAEIARLKEARFAGMRACVLLPGRFTRSASRRSPVFTNDLVSLRLS